MIVQKRDTIKNAGELWNRIYLRNFIIHPER